MMSASQWHMRIENQYHAMCAFPFNRHFSWRVAEGQRTPRVMAYKVTYYVKTPVMVNGKLQAQEKTEVLITMSDSPGGNPTARIISGKIPYLPNLYTNGNFCLGTMWSGEPVLWKLVINIGYLLALDADKTHPGSPANSSAANDWNDQKSALYKFRTTHTKVHFPTPVGYH